MEPRSVVALFVRDGQEGKEILAISRKGKPEDLGLVGGKIEQSDEGPLGALLREVREEVGVEITGSEMIYERVDPADGNVAWCYQVNSYTGKPRACEPNTVVEWVPPQRLLKDNCTFREYNRGLLDHLGLVDPTEDWEGFDPSLVIPLMSEEELRKFVIDFLENRIFTDKHIHPNDYKTMLPMVFMPLVFGVFSKYSKDSLKQIGCIYSYYDKTIGSRAINGYPMFSSVHFMHIDDWTRAAKAIEREEKRREQIEV